MNVRRENEPKRMKAGVEMRRSMKRLLMATAATAAILGISVPADAGKGGSFSGMSRGGMSRSGGSMSRNIGGMNSRSVSGGSFSSRNITTPARGMARPSFGQSNTMSNSARYLNGSVSRGRGVSSLSGSQRLSTGLGRVQNAAKGSAVNRRSDGGPRNGNNRLSDLAKVGAIVGGKKPINGGSLSSNRIQKVLSERLGSQRLSQGKPGRVAESLLKGHMNTRNVAKIDRSKLRDLVKGIESGKVTGPVDGGRPDDLAGARIADALRGGRNTRFNKAGWLAVGAAPLKPLEKSLLAGGCFPSDKDHWRHEHWLGLHFGDLWLGHCHDHHYHDYDYCWQPYYVAPPCTVTFGAYPEVVTVVDPQPILVDQEIDLNIDLSEPANAAATGAEPAVDEAADAEVTLAAAEVDEPATEDPATESTLEDDADTSDGTAAESTIATTPRDPAVQSEFDVELIDVRMLTAGQREANVGPRFQVTVRNAGKRDVEKILVSLVACKEVQIDTSAIHTSAAVERLAAGEERALELTLPVEALSLNRDVEGRASPFKTLIAAVDSDERVNEGDEENNLALIDRVSFKLASK